MSLKKDYQQTLSSIAIICATGAGLGILPVISAGDGENRRESDDNALINRCIEESLAPNRREAEALKSPLTPKDTVLAHGCGERLMNLGSERGSAAQRQFLAKIEAGLARKINAGENLNKAGNWTKKLEQKSALPLQGPSR